MNADILHSGYLFGCAHSMESSRARDETRTTTATQATAVTTPGPEPTAPHGNSTFPFWQVMILTPGRGLTHGRGIRKGGSWRYVASLTVSQKVCPKSGRIWLYVTRFPFRGKASSCGASKELVEKRLDNDACGRIRSSVSRWRKERPHFKSFPELPCVKNKKPRDNPLLSNTGAVTGTGLLFRWKSTCNTYPGLLHPWFHIPVFKHPGSGGPSSLPLGERAAHKGCGIIQMRAVQGSAVLQTTNYLTVPRAEINQTSRKLYIQLNFTFIFIWKTDVYYRTNIFKHDLKALNKQTKKPPHNSTHWQWYGSLEILWPREGCLFLMNLHITNSQDIWF